MSIRGDSAEQLFRDGYNCSQAVFLAFSDDYGIDKNTALKISSGFGAGMGRLREVCGCVSGAFMAMGLHYSEKVQKAQLYAIQQMFAAEFKRDNGSIICRELLNLDGNSSPIPDERNETYYKKRPCPKLVNYTVCLLEDFLETHKV